MAFYEALAENESSVDVMGDDKLKIIAHEQLVSFQFRACLPLPPKLEDLPLRLAEARKSLVLENLHRQSPAA